MDSEQNAILIAPEDNVATVIFEAAAGETVRYYRSGEAVEITSGGVPKYHKIALCDIPKGDKIIKYGEVIGEAIRDIPRGAHVHSHNIQSGVQ